MPQHCFWVADWRVEPDLNRLSLNGQTIHLEPKVMKVLVCLAARPGEVISKSQFLNEVWADTFVTDDVLMRSISELRKTFADDSRSPRFIETIPKTGYRLIAPVRAETNGSAPAAASVPPRRSFRHALLFVPLILILAASALWLTAGAIRDRIAGPAPRVRPLTSDPGAEEFAALSPDGSEVTFVRTAGQGGASELVVKTLSGAGAGSTRRLTRGPAYGPVWSPDGRMIAFARIHGPESGIYLIRADGNDPEGQRIMAASWDPGHFARLSWHGETLVFAERDSPGEPYGLSLISIQGGAKRKITTPAARNGSGDFWPSFSPGGRSIAFIRSTNSFNEDLYVMPASGGAPRLIASGQSRIIGLTWNADGKEIVFSSNRGGGFHMSLWRVSAAGGTPRPVPEAADNALDPSISPRGGRLVYTHAYFDTNIWRIPIVGSSAPPGKLIHSTMWDGAPAYSPGGAKIAFQSSRSGAQEIWTCNADGSEPTQLTFLGTSPTDAPKWSPDGRRIAFHSRFQDYDQIYVIPSAGGQARRLTEGRFNHNSPAWSGDMKWIYFASRSTGEAQIWKVPADGGAAVQITGQGGRSPIEAPNGQYLFYTKQGHPGIWRVPVNGGPEEQAREVPAEASSHWTVTPRGIYFANRDQNRAVSIFFFDFGTRRTSRAIATLPGKVFGAIDVSPDHRWALAAVNDEATADLKLVENFR